jgi:hypothetical protein
MKRPLPLSKTNKYCRNAALKEKMLYDSAASSSAVEGVRVTSFKSIKKLDIKSLKKPATRKSS